MYLLKPQASPPYSGSVQLPTCLSSQLKTYFETGMEAVALWRENDTLYGPWAFPSPIWAFCSIPHPAPKSKVCLLRTSYRGRGLDRKTLTPLAL